MTPGRVLRGILLYVIVANSGAAAMAEEVGCVTNAWTKPTGGLWEEPFWSCGRLPARDHGMIALLNAGSKTVEVGPTTTASFSNALSLYALKIGAPADSFNELRLNNAGTNVPLNVLLLNVGTNGLLTSYGSAVKATDLDIYSSALIAESSRLAVTRIRLWGDLVLSNSFSTVSFFPVHPNGTVTHFGGISEMPRTVLDGGSTFILESGNVSMQELLLKYPAFGPTYGTTAAGVARFVQNGGDLRSDLIRFGTPNSAHRGEFLLTGGSLQSERLEFLNGSFRQSGGTNNAVSISVPTGAVGRSSDYMLSDGVLISEQVSLGVHTWPPQHPDGHFVQSGGIHQAGSVSLNGVVTHAGRTMDQMAVHFGFYTLSGGILTCNGLGVRGGFTQSGGTNRAQAFSVSGGGRYLLSGGELATSSTFVGGFRAGAYSCSASGGLTQDAGTHSIENDLVIGNHGTYRLQAGSLVAPNIAVSAHASLRCTSGVISNSGTFTMNGGTFVPGTGAHHLGKLVLLGEQDTTWPCPAPTNSLVLDGSTNATDVRFSRSSDVAWSGSGLRILGWQRSAGSPRIFFGANPRGLTAAQRSKIVFVNPGGWPSGEYPARILTTGEILPVMRPQLAAARSSNGLALTWPEGYDLFRATNVAGPFIKVDDATSPNLFNAPQQFFQLRLREE